MLIEKLEELISNGGFVMPPLLMCVCIAWWLIGKRWMIVRAPSRNNVDIRLKPNHKDGLLGELAMKLRENSHPQYIESLISEYSALLNQDRKLLKTVIAVAPLLGLLGTVTGMIETFRGLGQSTLFSQSGGVAGGIAEALLTTQMGLIVAAPAILASRYLDRQAEVTRSRMIGIVKRGVVCED